MRSSNTSYYIPKQCEEPGNTSVFHSIIYAHSRAQRPRLRGQQVGWDLSPLVPLGTHKLGSLPAACARSPLRNIYHVLLCPGLGTQS